MNITLIALLFLVATGLEAAEWMVDNHDIKYPGKCVIDEDEILDEGKTVKDVTHGCRQIICGANGLTIYQSCGTLIGLPLGCTFGDFKNPDKLYPLCCERNIICV